MVLLVNEQNTELGKNGADFLEVKAKHLLKLGTGALQNWVVVRRYLSSVYWTAA